MFDPVAHPDGCHAIRIDEPSTGDSLVLATDIEWTLMSPGDRDAFAAFARNAGTLYFDCQYLPEELPSHRTWGHSSWQEAAEAARLSSVQSLHPIHFSPSCTEEGIAAIRARLERVQQ